MSTLKINLDVAQQLELEAALKARITILEVVVRHAKKADRLAASLRVQKVKDILIQVKEAAS